MMKFLCSSFWLLRFKHGPLALQIIIWEKWYLLNKLSICLNPLGSQVECQVGRNSLQCPLEPSLVTCWENHSFPLCSARGVSANPISCVLCLLSPPKWRWFSHGKVSENKVSTRGQQRVSGDAWSTVSKEHTICKHLRCSENRPISIKHSLI